MNTSFPKPLLQIPARVSVTERVDSGEPSDAVSQARREGSVPTAFSAGQVVLQRYSSDYSGAEVRNRSRTSLPSPSAAAVASSSLSMIPRQARRRTATGPQRVQSDLLAQRPRASPYPRFSPAHLATEASRSATQPSRDIVSGPRGVVLSAGEVTAVAATFAVRNYDGHRRRKDLNGIAIPHPADVEAIANRPASPGTPAYIYQDSHKTNPKNPTKVTINAGDVLRIQTSTSIMVAVKQPSTVKTGFFVEDSSGRKSVGNAAEEFAKKIRRDQR